MYTTMIRHGPAPILREGSERLARERSSQHVPARQQVVLGHAGDRLSPMQLCAVERGMVTVGVWMLKRVFGRPVGARSPGLGAAIRRRRAEGERSCIGLWAARSPPFAPRPAGPKASSTRARLETLLFLGSLLQCRASDDFLCPTARSKRKWETRKALAVSCYRVKPSKLGRSVVGVQLGPECCYNWKTGIRSSTARHGMIKPRSKPSPPPMHEFHAWQRAGLLIHPPPPSSFLVYGGARCKIPKAKACVGPLQTEEPPSATVPLVWMSAENLASACCSPRYVPPVVAVRTILACAGPDWYVAEPAGCASPHDNSSSIAVPDATSSKHSMLCNTARESRARQSNTPNRSAN